MNRILIAEDDATIRDSISSFLTDKDYFVLLVKQNYSCAICGSKTPNNGCGNEYFDIDHCHITGLVRGLLCRDCNVTVGVVEKKKEKLILIQQYILHHAEFDPKPKET